MGTPLKCQAVYLCLNHDHQREKTIIKIKIILFQFFFFVINIEKIKYTKFKVLKRLMNKYLIKILFTLG